MPGSLADPFDKFHSPWSELPREALFRELLIDPTWKKYVASGSILCHNNDSTQSTNKDQAMNPELMVKIAGYRQKVLSGEITDGELRDALAHLRQDRLSAAQASKTKKAAASAAVPSPDDVLAMFGTPGVQ